MTSSGEVYVWNISLGGVQNITSLKKQKVIDVATAGENLPIQTKHI